MSLMRVFVSSAFAGDIKENTKLAVKYCRFVSDNGYAPYAPHLLCPQWLDEHKPEHRRLGIDIGLSFLKACKMNWAFFPAAEMRWSSGMAEERDLAFAQGIDTYVFFQGNGAIDGPYRLYRTDDFHIKGEIAHSLLEVR